MHNAVKVCLPDWDKVHRLVPSHFPPVDLFEEVAEPGDLDIIFELESMTNDRLLQEAGDIKLVPEEQRVTGPGATPIMAAFTHIGLPSRFTDGRHYGVYYGAKALETAIKETVYHREVFMRSTDEPDTELTMRCYINQIVLVVHDIRGKNYAFLHTEEYAPPQAFAAVMRRNGSNGLVYNSVRDEGGECVAVFNPKALTLAIQAGHYRYLWRNKENKITDVLHVSQVDL